MANAIKLTVDAADWQRQVNEAVKTLEKLFYYFDKERETMLNYAARPMVDAMQRGAPRGSKVHFRYMNRRDSSGRKRSGEGQQVAKYYPGNLKGAFRVLGLKRTKDVIVGAKLAKSGTKGTFGGKRFDAYYLHWIEYGTRNMAARPFVRPAIISASPAVIKRMAWAANKFTERFARQNAYKG